MDERRIGELLSRSLVRQRSCERVPSPTQFVTAAVRRLVPLHSPIPSRGVKCDREKRCERHKKMFHRSKSKALKRKKVVEKGHNILSFVEVFTRKTVYFYHASTNTVKSYDTKHRKRAIHHKIGDFIEQQRDLPPQNHAHISARKYINISKNQNINARKQKEKAFDSEINFYLCSTTRQLSKENAASILVFHLNHRHYAHFQSLFSP